MSHCKPHVVADAQKLACWSEREEAWYSKRKTRNRFLRAKKSLWSLRICFLRALRSHQAAECNRVTTFKALRLIYAFDIQQRQVSRFFSTSCIVPDFQQLQHCTTKHKRQKLLYSLLSALSGGEWEVETLNIEQSDLKFALASFFYNWKLWFTGTGHKYILV